MAERNPQFELGTMLPFPPRLLRLKDAAAYLCISDKRLRQLVQKESLPYIRNGEGATSPWLFDRADLDAWVERSKIKF